jgi:Zn-dependent protease/predicted transcriptional regulator
VIFALVTYFLATGWLVTAIPGSTPAGRWVLAIILAGALFASVLLHELSHALVARTRRVEVDEIMLFIFGGVAKLKGEPRDALSDLLIAAAGPLLSTGLGLMLLAIAQSLPAGAPETLRAGLSWLGLINVALAVFNMVPGFPLDGGRILRAILWWRFDDYERATIGAARTGKVIAGLLMGIGFLLIAVTGNFSWLWEILIGWFLWSAANHSVRMSRLRGAVEGVTVRDLITERVPAIRADHDVRVALAQASQMEPTSELAIVERDRTLVGVATVDALEEAALEAPQRPARDLARPVADDQVLSPDVPANEMISQIARIESGLVLVVEDGRLIGTIDPKALLRALQNLEPPQRSEEEPP